MNKFDERRYFLGELCSFGHEFEGTGKSLRYKNGKACLVCRRILDGTYGKYPLFKEGLVDDKKRCVRCQRLFPPTLQYFYRSNCTRDGLKGTCKECCGHPFSEDPLPEGYKKCSRCKTIYDNPQEHFHKRTATSTNLYSWCKKCVKETGSARQKTEEFKQRASEKRRTEEYRQKVRSYRQRPEVKEKTRALKQTEHYKAKGREYNNSEKAKAQRARYDQSEQGKTVARIKTINKRARKRSLPDTFTPRDWQRSLEYFNGCCAVCERPLRDLFGSHTASADHWIPLVSPNCPGTVPTNIVPLCHGVGGCNNSKEAKNASEWLIGKFGKRRAREILKRIEAYFEWVKQFND